MKSGLRFCSGLLTPLIMFQLLISVMLVNAKAAELMLTMNGLADLGADARYQAWLLVDDAPNSVGVFQVDALGNLSQSVFMVDDALANEAMVVMVSVEPFPDVNPAPANARLMAGNINNGEAVLGIGHPTAIGDDLSGVLGQFNLANPTGDKGSSLENGIWYFTDLVAPNPGLDLASLPAGWVYQGWVSDLATNQSLSTGTFREANEADSDGPGANAGIGEGLPFPGQDYINPPRDLSVSHQAFISVEPVPDNAPEPFVIRVLQNDIADQIGNQSLNNTALATSPTGQAVISLGSGPLTTQPVPILSLLSIMAMAAMMWLISRRFF